MKDRDTESLFNNYPTPYSDNIVIKGKLDSIQFDPCRMIVLSFNPYKLYVLVADTIDPERLRFYWGKNVEVVLSKDKKNALQIWIKN